MKCSTWPSLTTSGLEHFRRCPVASSGIQRNTAMVISQEERVAHIRKRAHELWEREGLMPDREKACWDKAVEEFESGKLTAGRKQAGADAAGDTSGAKH
ncbi:DUF2934 domain-containing protein [Mesorhizobium sp. B2-3-11]|nr:DUF2934 domain-containing protein [Mesorhizobium sp. B2-3-11]